MNHQRLETLKDMLRGIAPRRFNLRHWYVVHECGTVACAGGWAAQYPAFVREGLSLDNTMPYNILYTDSSRGDGIVLRNYDALAAFFDLTDREALAIFDPWEYVDPAISPLSKKEAPLERIDRCMDMVSQLGPDVVIRRIDEVMDPTITVEAITYPSLS